MTARKPPTSDRIRIAIDNEGQSDKVNFPDPAAAPLGTDAEASGHAPGAEELSMAAPDGGPRPRTRWIGLSTYILIAAFVFGCFIAIVMMA